MGINWGCVTVMASRGLMGGCMRASGGKLGLCDGRGIKLGLCDPPLQKSAFKCTDGTLNF